MQYNSSAVDMVQQQSTVVGANIIMAGLLGCNLGQKPHVRVLWCSCGCTL